MGALAAEFAVALEGLDMEFIELMHIPGTSNKSADSKGAALPQLLDHVPCLSAPDRKTALAYADGTCTDGESGHRNSLFVCVQNTKKEAVCRGAWRQERQTESWCHAGRVRADVVMVRDGAVGWPTPFRRLVYACLFAEGPRARCNVSCDDPLICWYRQRVRVHMWARRTAGKSKKKEPSTDHEWLRPEVKAREKSRPPVSWRLHLQQTQNRNRLSVSPLCVVARNNGEIGRTSAEGCAIE